MKQVWQVGYDGFLRKVHREFPTHRRALEWVRQVGVRAKALITRGIK